MDAAPTYQNIGNFHSLAFHTALASKTQHKTTTDIGIVRSGILTGIFVVFHY